MVRRPSWDLRNMVHTYLNAAVALRNGDLKEYAYNQLNALRVGIPWTLKEHGEIADMMQSRLPWAIDHLKRELERCNRLLKVNPIEVNLPLPQAKQAKLEDAIEAIVNSAKRVSISGQGKRGGKSVVDAEALVELRKALRAWDDL